MSLATDVLGDSVTGAESLLTGDFTRVGCDTISGAIESFFSESANNELSHTEQITKGIERFFDYCVGLTEHDRTVAIEYIDLILKHELQNSQISDIQREEIINFFNYCKGSLQTLEDRPGQTPQDRPPKGTIWSGHPTI